ncbi:MAG: hypothetical protein WB765_11265, partial [Acidimicrobiales bacterium]
GADTLISQVPTERSAEIVEVTVGPPFIARPHRVAIAVECASPLQGMMHKSRGHWKHSSRL